MVIDRLKNLRKLKNISQKDFANTIGVSQQAVASWEVGRTEPSNTVLKVIADYFGVSVDYLLGNDTVRTDPPLSKDQITLLEGFDALTVERQNTLLTMLDFLCSTQTTILPKTQQQTNSTIIQNNGINIVNSKDVNFDSSVPTK